MNDPFVDAIISAYGEIITHSVPIAAFIACCNIGINLLVRAFTGRDLHIGGDR